MATLSERDRGKIIEVVVVQRRDNGRPRPFRFPFDHLVGAIREEG
jgi:hypothetical protein